MIISVLVLYGLGMFFWGYRTGISKATDDLEELAKEMQRNDLKIGDTIRCHDKDDTVNTDLELCRLGYKTDYLYEKDGKKGYWIEILGKTED